MVKHNLMKQAEFPKIATSLVTFYYFILGLVFSLEISCKIFFDHRGYMQDQFCQDFIKV